MWGLSRIANDAENRYKLAVIDSENSLVGPVTRLQQRDFELAGRQRLFESKIRSDEGFQPSAVRGHREYGYDEQ
jgi:hypothetical protein